MKSSAPARRRGDAVLIRRVKPAVADILHDGAGEKIGVLKDDAEGTAQVGLLYLVDIYAVIADLAVGNIIKAVDEVGDGGLAGTRRADEGDLLAGLCIDGDVVQNVLPSS